MISNFVYLAADILVILFPFLLSFERKVRFWRKWPFLVPGYLTVSVVFIIWDIIVTRRGDWSFNPEYTLGIGLLGLPVEELLFFIVVPYSCMFTYEVLAFYLKDRKVPFAQWPYIVSGVLFLIAAFIFRDQGYTLLAMLSCALVSIAAPFMAHSMLSSRVFWAFVVVTMGMFVAMNMVLTSLPVVQYSPDAIWGGDGLWNGRFFHIPLEDFFYNLSLLTSFLMVYLLAKRLMTQEKTL